MNELKTKSGTAIIADLHRLVKEERKTLTSILHYLREVEERRLYQERGYSSLFAFITEELGYSESAAQRRIQAMRLMRDVPAVEEKLESGQLSLSVASQVRSFLYFEEKKRGECCGEALSMPEKLGFIEQPDMKPYGFTNRDRKCCRAPHRGNVRRNWPGYRRS